MTDVGCEYRRQQFETQLLINTWKVKWEDIEPLRSGKSKDGSTVSVVCCIHVKVLLLSVHYHNRVYFSILYYTKCVL